MAPEEKAENKASCSEGGGAVNHTGSEIEDRCRLLELPTELQLIIYELVVVHHEAIKLNLNPPSSWPVSKRRNTVQERDKRLRLQPSLTRTCKAIRQTALPIYLGCNIFEGYYYSYELTGHFVAWLAAMGPHNRQLLHAVYATHAAHELDVYCPAYLNTFKSTVAQFHAEVVTVTVSSGVRHRVTFPVEEVGETEVAE